MNIASNIKSLKDSLPPAVTLVAVSKFHSSQTIMEAYQAGHRIFGESRMQEMDKKHAELPSDIQWHFIGHLQRNKVRDIIQYTHTIHSVDSLRLFREIDKQTTENQRAVCCLLQIHVADEESKYGFSLDECRQFLASAEWKDYQYAYLGGIMGMATNTEDEGKVRAEFRLLKQFYDELKESYFKDEERFKELSMGMSSDYEVAIEEGSTMIRVGSSIFGEREY